MLLRSDTAGTLQALVELWQILLPPGFHSAEARDATLVKLIQPFTQLKQEADLFNAGRAGVKTLLAAASPESPDRARTAWWICWWARGTNPSHMTPAEYFLRIFEAQRLVSLDGCSSRLTRSRKEPPTPRR